MAFPARQKAQVSGLAGASFAARAPLLHITAHSQHRSLLGQVKNCLFTARRSHFI